MLKLERIPLILAIVFLASAISPSFVHSSFGATTGEVCLADPSTASATAPCPASPPTFTGSVNHSITVGVFISGSAGLDGFTVILLANSAILRPVSVDLTNSVLLGTPTILTECLSRVSRLGNCSPADTLNTTDVSATSALGKPNTVTPTTGLLFATTYNVTGATPPSGISIGFRSSTSCGTTSVSGNVCVTIANGSPTPNPETVQGASFTSALVPDFAISVNPSSLAVNAGTSAPSTLSIVSIDGFSGIVALSDTTPPTISLTTPTPISLLANMTSISPITVITSTSTPQGGYTITIIATSGSVVHQLGLFVEVLPAQVSDFGISAIPDTLFVQAGNPVMTTITLTSIGGFHGTLSLSRQILPRLGVNSTNIGATITLSPSVVSLLPNGSVTSILNVATSTTTPSDQYIITVTASNATKAHFATVALIVYPPPDEPPIASFTVSPVNPIAGQTVTFDGSSSSDPDGSITQWTWNFGDQTPIFVSFTPTIQHTFTTAGSFSVLLSVGDTAGLSATTSMIVNVIQKPTHDVAIVQVNIFPNVVVSSGSVGISAQLTNTGIDNETASLTAYANGHPVGTLSRIFLPACRPNPFPYPFCFNNIYVTVVWNTTGSAPGNYTISATVFLPVGEVDPTPGDNSFTDGVVTVLPPPALSLTPTSGPAGEKVQVRGTGFFIVSAFYQNIHPVQISFDGNSIGTAYANNGSFTFSFDVILSQPGITHQVIAIDYISGAKATAVFTVTQSQAGSLSVTINTGAVYFPGDTVVVYALTSLSGVPVGAPNVQLQLLLVEPNGSKITLSASSVSTGLYRATFAIPKTGLLGTYLVMAKAHMAGPLDSSAIASFEVQLSWLNGSGGKIAGVATVVGLVGLTAVAWRKGYLKRRSRDEPTQLF